MFILAKCFYPVQRGGRDVGVGNYVPVHCGFKGLEHDLADLSPLELCVGETMESDTMEGSLGLTIVWGCGLARDLGSGEKDSYLSPV